MSDIPQKLYELIKEKNGSAQVVILQGEIGRGKTFNVQRFYDSLCGTAGNNTPWQSGLAPAGVPRSTRELFLERKNVRGLKVSPITADTPWLWIAATCTSSLSDFDVAAADLGDQLDEFVRDLGFEAAWSASKVVASGLADIASDLLGLSTAKTVAETVRGLARVAISEYDSRPGAQTRSLRLQRSALIENAIRRLGVETHSDGSGKPLVAVLDDAHLAEPESLRLLSSLLMPAAGTADVDTYFPRGVAVRQNPIMVVLCRWTHTDRAPAYADSPLNEWVRQAEAVGVPMTVIDTPWGMSRSDALEIAAGEFPELSDEDRQLVIGDGHGGTINPLVLKMRIAEASGYFENPKRATSLSGIEVSRLPQSPLDPVRDIFEALPFEEKKIVAALASFGVPAPIDILCDEPGANPFDVLASALENGLVARVGKHADELNLIWFTDDLSRAFFEDRPALFASDLEIESGWIGRFQPWLERVALNDQIPISVLAVLGSVVARAMRMHRANSEIAWFAASALVDPGVDSASRRRMQALRKFRTQSEGWSEAQLAAQMIAFAAIPKVLGKDSWAVLFSTASARRHLVARPRGLAARAVALSRRTMPCLELRDSILGAVAIDGEVALWRIGSIAALFVEYDLAAELEKLDIGVHLEKLRRLAVAQARGHDEVIALLESDPPRTESELIALSDSYAANGRFDIASTTLNPLLGSTNFAIRSARLALHAGDRERAIELLGQHAELSIEAALALANTLGDDIGAAIAVLEPYLDLNPEARSRTSKLLAKAGRFSDAIEVLLPIEESGSRAVQQALRSLRGRRLDVPREEVLKAAEEAWKSGDPAEAVNTLESYLDDVAVLSAWSEYAWLVGDRSTVIDLLATRVGSAPTLSVSLGEFANEAPSEALELVWLSDPPSSDTDLWLSGVRLLHKLEGAAGVAAARLWQDQHLPSRVYGVVTAIERAGSHWGSDLKLALTLERLGHVDWAEEVLEPWAGEGPGEAHSVRLLVDYGELNRASEKLFTTRDRSITMASARAIWHLANDAPDEAARAFRNCASRTPQVRRLGEVLSHIPNNPLLAIEASELLFQMRQPSTAVAVLAFAARSDEHPDVSRAYKRARYGTPEDQRRAFGRHRRRHAIRGALAAMYENETGDAG